MELDPLVRKAVDLTPGFTTRTPLLRCLSPRLAKGPQLFAKLENLQRTGSFKFRGAYFRVSQLSSSEKRSGVLTYSSGNFGIALAEAGRLFDVPVTIVVPPDAPASKCDAIRARGAVIKKSLLGAKGRETSAEEYARNYASRNAVTLLHPFEDSQLIAGHATLALELFDQAAEHGIELDHLFIPGGGGGLLAACVTARNIAGVRTAIHCVEPAGYNSIQLSLQQGKRSAAPDGSSTICDALQAEKPGAIAFDLINGQAPSCHSVSDPSVVHAMRLLFDEFHIVVEPSSALALAGILAQWQQLQKGTNVACLLTGGNISYTEFSRHLEAA
ncbi:MAG: pyridoxal-phosphate dependent enzyme [Nitratireductor sp.]